MSGSLVRIGVLHDFPTADDGRSFERNLRLGLQTVVDSGRLDDQIEIVHAAGLGLPLPGGSAHAVERAFVELAEQGVAAIVGPAISDNAIVVQPLADRARIPTLNYTGSEETRSEYGFQYQLGSLEDEPSFRRGIVAEVEQMAVAARLHTQPGRRCDRQVCRHVERRSSIEGEGRPQHASVPNGDQLGKSPPVRLREQAQRIRAAACCLPDRVRAAWTLLAQALAQRMELSLRRAGPSH